MEPLIMLKKLAVLYVGIYSFKSKMTKTVNTFNVV